MLVTVAAGAEPSRAGSRTSGLPPKGHGRLKSPVQRSKGCNALRWTIAVLCVMVSSAVAVDMKASAMDAKGPAVDLKDAMGAKVDVVHKNATAVDPKVVTVDPKVVTVDPNAAAKDTSAAAVDVKAGVVDAKVSDEAAAEEVALGAGVAAGAAAAEAAFGALEESRPEAARAGLPSFIRLPSIWSFIKLPAFLKPSVTGKSSFLTGFGLGFLAFALKKLLLPLFIGGQILKSVLIAMFLPSILGGLGKLLGKGVTSFASASGPLSGGLSGGGLSGGLGGGDGFGGGGYGDFREPTDGGLGDADADAAASDPSAFAYADAPHYATNGVSQPASAALGAHNRVSVAQSKVSGGGAHSQSLDAFYSRPRPPAFASFQQMPASSLLLAHYDPFYSPLLSRLDSVFAALGRASEACRQRLVCDMYAQPARFAPFSNLVSAQLSRELNELRKPSTDNPEILRFFRYMKAAKDGQDGHDCELLHPGCSEDVGAAEAAAAGAGPAAGDGPGAGSPPMLQTFHDIDKLVQARRALS